MCMFSNVAQQEATEQQRKLAEDILGVVGVLIQAGYILNDMLDETVEGQRCVLLLLRVRPKLIICQWRWLRT